MRKALFLAPILAVLASPAPADELRFGPAAAFPHGNAPQAEAPAGTLTLSLDGEPEQVWPFTADDFGEMVEDPVNLVFLGEADPRNLRAILLGLDGDRSRWGMPRAYPFDCTWADGAGNEQAGFAAGQWAASPIQLQCGRYDQLRTHLRLFRYGRFTLGAAHFEVMVPGTADHRVLSWEFPEQLVTVDLLRSGYLASPPSSTPPISPVPSYRTLDHRLHAALLGAMAPLMAAMGLPVTPQAAPIPLPSDGRARVLRVAGTAPFDVMDETRTYHRDYDVVDLKPFCAGPADAIRIRGPVDIVHHVTVSEQGEVHVEQEARGVLTITPLSGPGAGQPVPAHVRERQLATAADGTAWAENVVRRTLLGATEQSLFQKLRVGAGDRFELDVDCGE